MTRVVRPAPGPARRLRPAAGRGQPRAGARAGRARLAGAARPVRAVPGRRGSVDPGRRPGQEGRGRDPGPRPALRGPGRPAAAAGPGGARGDQQLRTVPARPGCGGARAVDDRHAARRRLPAGGDRAARWHRAGGRRPRRRPGGVPGGAGAGDAAADRRRPAQPDPPRVRPRRDRAARPPDAALDRRGPRGVGVVARRHHLPDRDVRGAGRRGRRRRHRHAVGHRVPQRGLRHGVRDRVVRDALARDQPRRARRRTTCSTRWPRSERSATGTSPGCWSATTGSPPTSSPGWRAS